MKKLIILAFIAASGSCFGQSKSFQTLKEKFSDDRNVTSFRVGGFFLRTALWLAGENDLRTEAGEIKGVRLITIPQKNFQAHNLKLSGFKKVLARDQFEEVIYTRNGKENVTIYLREHKSQSNLYFVLIENEREVTAIEIKGNLDPKKIAESNSKQKFSSI